MRRQQSSKQDGMHEFISIIVSVWNTAVFGIGIGPVITALAVLALSLLARGVFTRFVLSFFRVMAQRTENKFDDQLVDALELPVRFVFVVIGIYIASQIAPFPDFIDVILLKLVRSLIVFTIFWALYRIIRPLAFLLDKVSNMVGAQELGDALRDFFVKLLKFAVACLGIAAFLEEWDFNVAAVLGGLGLVGMALAFGAQNLIANLFAGISIFLDGIFEKGHWIRAGSVEGTVETIGFRTTKIRRFDKALVTVPNSVLTGDAVINFTQMTNRRIYWQIGLTYGSTEAQLREVVEAIRGYIQDCGDFETDSGRATTLVNVDSFNASSIDIMVYCFTKTTKWGEYMVVKEKFAYKVKEIVEGAGGSFAFPSTSIYLEQWPFGTPESFPLAPAAG